MANTHKPPKFYSPKTSPFLNSVREAIRVRHLARSTERSYLYYITDFIRFHGRKHPRELGLEEVRAYLTDLAVNQNVSAHALVFSAMATVLVCRIVMLWEQCR